MPRQKGFNGFITYLINDYVAHQRQKNRSFKKPKDYILIINFTQPETGQNCYNPSTMHLRLRTLSDMADIDNYAIINSTLYPITYARNLITKEKERYTRRGITIDDYVIGTPNKPLIQYTPLMQ